MVGCLLANMNSTCPVYTELHLPTQFYFVGIYLGLKNKKNYLKFRKLRNYLDEKKHLFFYCYR